MLESVSAGLVSFGFLFAAVGYATGLISGPVAVIGAVGLTTAVYTALLVARALRLHITAAPCQGVGLLGMGVLAGGAGLVGGAVLASRAGAYAASRAGAYAVVVGVAASVVLFLVALLLLPGVAPSVRSRIRRLVDGLAIGTCFFFAGWSLLVIPLSGDHAGPVGPHVVTAVTLLVVLCSALATLTLIGMRAAQYRTAALFCACGAALALTEQGTVVMLLLLGAGWHLVLAAAALWALGPLLMWLGARRSAHRPPRRDTDVRVRSGNVGTLPLLGISALLALLGAIYQLIRYGDLGPYTTLLGLLAAVSVGLREGFSGFDLRRYARRVAEREAQFRTTDPLTGAPNRVRLRHRLETERDRVPVGERCGSLLVIDLDNFGELDDAAGHDAGDTVLMEVARRLRTSVGTRDLAVRLAGDAFAVYTPGPAAQAVALADRLKVRLAEAYPLTAETVSPLAQLTVSIGISECSSAATVDQMIRCAELAVSSAKGCGGGQVRSYDESLELRTLRRETFSHELRQVLDGGELELLYAPVVELAGTAPVGLRAELRWRHPTLGVVSADEFEAAAEDSGLSRRIGDWTLHRAVRQLGGWLAEGRDLWLAVRVWPAHLRAPRFRDSVLALCRQHRVPPYRLVIEVSEAAMPSAGTLAEPLTQLQAAGFTTALTEFGSGPCSLLELPELPLDLLSVAAPLVAGLGDSEPVVAAVTVLARHLGVDVVAAGVSGAWQLELLRGHGCRFATGPLFSRPVPAEHAEAYLDANAGGTDANLRP